MKEDREFELLVAACRAAFDQNARERVHELAGAVRWDRLVRLALFHRVEGLCWQALEGIEGVPEELHRQSQAIAARNLRSAATCSELLDLFERAHLPILFLKGLPLGVLAYGTPWIKSAVDIDILIDESRLAESVELVRRAGFGREGGKPEDLARLREWHRFRKDLEWVRPGTDQRVDLHTRLTDNRALIPGVGLGSPRTSVEIMPRCSLPTLAADEQFAHLCVHGATSAWFRLKWLTDLAAVVHRMAATEVERIYARSQELGAGRAAGQALVLADHMFGTLERCPGLRHSLNGEPAIRRLARLARRQLCGRAEPVEPTARTGGTMLIHLSQFLLLPGLSYKASELARQARAAANSFSE